MKLPILITASLFITPCVMAESEGKTFGDGACLPKYLAQYDVKGPNGPPDGKLDQEEVQAMKKMREQKRLQEKKDVDANGDGVVCDEEREQAKQKIRKAIEEHRLMRFDEADTLPLPDGGDGYLSWEEWIVLPGVARKLEIDEARVTEIFARLDANNDEGITDGLISRDEFVEGVRQCDQDRDGTGDGKQTGRGGTGGGGGGGGS